MLGEPAPTICELGTVGWEGSDQFYSKGTDQDSGHLFIHVQLFKGRDFTKELNPDIGQGSKILCKMSSHIHRIPPRGTLVYVIFPNGMDHAVGSGCIIATIERNPTIQLEEDRVVIDYGEDTHIIIKGKSVSLSSHNNEFVSVGQPRSGGDPGIVLQTANGSGGFVSNEDVYFFAASGGEAKSVVRMESDGVTILYKGSATSAFKLNDDLTISVPNLGYITPATLFLGATSDPSKWKTVTTAGGASTGVMAVAL